MKVQSTPSNSSSFISAVSAFIVMGYRTRLGTPLSIIPTLGRMEGRRKRDEGRGEERTKTEGREGHETRRPRCLHRRSGDGNGGAADVTTKKPSRRRRRLLHEEGAAGAMAAGESRAEAPQSVRPAPRSACMRARCFRLSADGRRDGGTNRAPHETRKRTTATATT